MNITILAVGKPKTAYLEPAIKEYEQRLAARVKIAWQFVPTSNNEEESARIIRAVPTGCHVILLDERGVPSSTPQLAETIEMLQNRGTKSVTFIIGGAHGVNGAVRKRADLVWKLSDLIFPHELVRLILIEQLYRAYDLNHGGNYHHV